MLCLMENKMPIHFPMPNPVWNAIKPMLPRMDLTYAGKSYSKRNVVTTIFFKLFTDGPWNEIDYCHGLAPSQLARNNLKRMLASDFLDKMKDLQIYGTDPSTGVNWAFVCNLKTLLPRR